MKGENKMFKLIMYVRALVEVTEGNKKFLSRVPWDLYFYYRLDRFLYPEKYNDFKIRLLLPWEFVIDKSV